MKKLLLLIFSAFTLSCQAQTIIANPDTFRVLQANVDTFAVTRNDSIPAGDSVCITLLDTASRFSILNCNSIIYHPDSFFTGRDSCRYVLCDTAHICDTTMVVIYVDTVYSLWLPVASFVDDSIYFDSDKLFACAQYFWHDTRILYQLSSTSIRADSVSWIIKGNTPGNPLYDSLRYFTGDTIQFRPGYIWTGQCYQSYGICNPQTIQVCLTAYNQYGSTTWCDTSCDLTWEGISEVPLSNINIFPRPADRSLTIDMRQNSDLISSTYSAIIIYNSFGQRIRSIARHDSSRLVELSVADMSDGIYLATITDAKGAEQMLGKFVLAR